MFADADNDPTAPRKRSRCRRAEHRGSRDGGAEVAEQTVYNYFPAKEQLVIDRDQRIQDRLCELIRSRPPGLTPAAAIAIAISPVPPEIATVERRDQVTLDVLGFVPDARGPE